MVLLRYKTTAEQEATLGFLKLNVAKKLKLPASA